MRARGKAFGVAASAAPASALARPQPQPLPGGFAARAAARFSHGVAAPSLPLLQRKKKGDSEAAAGSSSAGGGAPSDAVSAALEVAFKHIQQTYGKGSILRLGDRTSKLSGVDVISTGSLSLDHALGVGGLPRGRVVEIYGPEASGKTTLALHVIAEAQKRGLNCVFVDAEHAINMQYARAIGVDVEKLYLVQPDHGEQALDITDTLMRSGGVGVIVVDSVAALVPRAELEGDMGDPHMALQARLMSQALRKMTGHLAQSNCLLIFINQIRHKVGVMFGSPEVTTGGQALKFYASVRIDIRRVQQLKQGEELVGSRVRCKVAKNKMAAPFQQVEFDMMFGKGISRSGELVDMALQYKVLQKSGAWFSFGALQLGQGREKTKAFLEQNPQVAAEIEKALQEAMAKGPAEVAAAPSETAEPEAEPAREDA
jgi:recombination protein RecA